MLSEQVKGDVHKTPLPHQDQPQGEVWGGPKHTAYAAGPWMQAASRKAHLSPSGLSFYCPFVTQT